MRFDRLPLATNANLKPSRDYPKRCLIVSSRRLPSVWNRRDSNVMKNIGDSGAPDRAAVVKALYDYRI